VPNSAGGGRSTSHGGGDREKGGTRKGSVCVEDVSHGRLQCSTLPTRHGKGADHGAIGGLNAKMS